MRAETLIPEKVEASRFLDELPYKGSPHRRPAEKAGETAKSLSGARINQEFCKIW